MKSAILLLILCASCGSGFGKQHRSQAQVSAFKRANPCPSTGAQSGPCKGYIVDHIQPLCAGGADNPSNMQWQTIDDAKAKDRDERKICKK